MTDRFDSFAKVVAERTTRRRTLAGMGALALSSLGILGVGQESEAKNNNNKCKQCKNQCQRNNKKSGKKNKNNCGNKCRNKCRNKNK